VISIILRTSTRLLVTLLPVVALFMLLRGHNEPGGGFIAGLIAAAVLVLYAVAYDASAARRVLRVAPRTLVSTGLMIAVLAAVIGLIAGDPLFTGQWVTLPLGPIGDIYVGTPLLFDIGVFLAVVGVVVTVMLLREEE
jgi:multisubunit Na+/H+ antiporter MnhB subunit